MTKFNVKNTRTAVSSPVVTEPVATGRTHEGAPGYARDTKGELFLLAVTNAVSEKTFYETGDARDARYRALVRRVALEDPAWLTGMLRWLRAEANVRSAALVGALEAVYARRQAGVESVERAIVDSVLQRADEPGEAIAYWLAHYGSALPKPLKKGVADAVVRLYNPRALLKYDTGSHGVRFGRVLDLTHPETTVDWQRALFDHAHARMRNHDSSIDPVLLPTIHENLRLRAEVAEGHFDGLMDAVRLRAAGLTWEDALSLAGNRVSKKTLWEALVPTLGYMALLRNLRNLDEAGVPDDVAESLGRRLADPEQVAASRQLPLRFLSAYRAAPSLRWSYALERALQASLANVPALGGRTLILVDTSSSMDETFSKDGKLKRWDAAVLFGAALATRAADAVLVSFSSTAKFWGDRHGPDTRVFHPKTGESLLAVVKRWEVEGYFLGGGTATAAALRRHYAGHDRVILLTDEQVAADATSGEVSAAVPEHAWLHTFNLAGYERGHAPSGLGTRHTIGGLTDRMFGLIPLLERGRNAPWPWEIADVAR